MRRVLIVSPHFPPTNAPDHQRVRASLPYYREFGWEPTVLAVDAASVEAPQDALLTATVPDDVPVHRVSALPVRLTRLAGLGNVAYRAWFALRREGARLLGAGRFDLVYFSTTQFVATGLGRRWLAEFGVPFVVDLQDPWRTDYYDRPGAPPPPGGWKYRFARLQAARLEGKSWSPAAGFTSVSASYFSDLEKRYAWFAGRPSAVIPFGAAETDFALARTGHSIRPAFVRQAGCVHLVNVGAVGPIMRTALTALFRGVQRLRAADPVAAGRLRFHFLGTSYAPAGRAEPSVIPIAAAHGAADLVEEVPERVSYFSAIKTMLEADALVIPGSDDPAYNPSKIAPCFLAEKPAIALTSLRSAMAASVGELGLGDVIDPVDAAAPEAVDQFLQRVLMGQDSSWRARRNTARFAEHHTARARTRQQAELFDRALAARAP